MDLSARKSNIELLRLLSMFLIVLSHCCVHTAWGDISTGRYILVSSLSLGEVGVASFVIISGYFSWGRDFKTKSFLRVVLQVIFYAFMCFICVKQLVPGNDLKWMEFPVFPIASGEYWFPTAFVALMLLQPILNELINSLGKSFLGKTICMLTILIIVIPFFIEGQFVYSNLLYFVYLYLIGSYIGKYPERFDRISSAKLLAALAGSFFLFAVLMLASILDAGFMRHFGISRESLLNPNSIPAVLMGVILFLLFRKINIRSNGFVNKAAKTSFGVYLISDNPNIRPLVWEWAKNSNFIESSVLIFMGHIVLSVMVVYVICSVIDYLRIIVLEKPFFAILKRPVDLLALKFDSAMTFSKVSGS